MFTSLKSRLWLTYALMIVLVLGAVGIGVLLSLRKSPLVYRQPLNQLEVVVNSTIGRINTNPGATGFESILTGESIKTKTRLALYRADGELVFDSDMHPGNHLVIPTPLSASGTGEIRFVNDQKNRGWLYTLKPINDQFYLMAAGRLPRLPLLLILRDELFTPFVRAGVLAMLLAVALAIIFGNWVEAPLNKLARQANAVTQGNARPIPLEGPAEIKQLVGTFNEMVTKLNASQESQRDFIANVSHELKTPLTSIQGFAQAILEQASPAPDETRQSAKIILNESQRMNKLVIGLLTLARLDAGITDSKKENVDLAVILRSVLERLTPQAQNASVTLVDQIGPVPEIMTDAENITQVFVNLIDNAIKYSKKGGKVTVSCLQHGAEVEVHIIDNGAGIPLQDQTRIFERFYQIDKSRRGGVKHGVGLGLAIANQIVKSMGGVLTVESTPGTGSDFMVKLPIE